MIRSGVSSPGPSIPGAIVALAVLLVCDSVSPKPATAQEGFQLHPSLTAAEIHDSNLFATASNHVSDFVTRITPAIDSEYRSTVWTVNGRYTFDAERFAGHPELSRVDARRQARAGFEYRPTRRLTLAADGELSSTQTPGDLNPLTGLVFTRARADRIAAHSVLARQLHRRTTGTLDYTFTRDRLAGAVDIQTQVATIGVDLHPSTRNVLKAKSSLQQFTFGSPDAGVSTATSVAFTLGWTRSLTRDMDIALDAGPRTTNGRIAPELSGAIRFRLDSGSVSFAYARTKSTVIGRPGMADTQSATATASWSPRRPVQLAVTSAFVRSQESSVHASVFRLMLDASHAIGRNLAIAIGGVANVQAGDLYARPGFGIIRQQQIMIKIVAQPDLQTR